MNNLLEKKSQELISTSAGGSVNSQSQLITPRVSFTRNNTTALYTTVDRNWLLALDVTKSIVSSTATSYPTEEVTQKIQNEAQKSINELRKLSGLTWKQLAELFNVSRRTLHFWASGQPINSPNEEKLNRLLGIIRYIDRGSASLNRNLLLMPGEDGTLTFDLLLSGKYQEVKNIIGSGNAPKRPKLNPLSEDSLKLRRPPSPENLVDALQDSIHREIGHSRPAKSVRSRKK